jgi:hypothetical protein
LSFKAFGIGRKQPPLNGPGISYKIPDSKKKKNIRKSRKFPAKIFPPKKKKKPPKFSRQKKKPPKFSRQKKKPPKFPRQKKTPKFSRKKKPKFSRL